jgi:hypothetical protein
MLLFRPVAKKEIPQKWTGDARGSFLACVKPRSKGKNPLRRGPYVEGVKNMSPKERERRLTKQRVDRSHRGVVVRQCRPPPWTRGEKAVLVLSLAFIFAAMGLGVVLPMP